MPYFLTQASYTPAAWSALMRNPHDRFESVRPAVEKLGGRAWSMRSSLMASMTSC